MTARGAGANFGGTFVACNPTFMTSTSQASATSGNAATFKDQGVGFDSVDSNGTCVQQNPQPFMISSCNVQACTSSGGGFGCFWPCTTPIIFDISGHGFSLTDVENGVWFDFGGTGKPIKLAWTAPGSDNAFLALPGPDGLVHDGSQLFGNLTPQPPSNDPNGFAALAVYDGPDSGGNADGMIDSRDAVFASLRLWIDANHDGVSQPDELFTLPSLGVTSIGVNYKESRRTDQYGNVFRYRGRVNGDTGKTAYDVIFVNRCAEGGTM